MLQDATVDTCVQIMRIPSGLGMWRSRAEALGWPTTMPMDDTVVYDVLQGGWGVLDPALAPWGRFKIGHALPNVTATGMNTILAAIADSLQWPNKVPLTKAAVRSPGALQVRNLPGVDANHGLCVHACTIIVYRPAQPGMCSDNTCFLLLLLLHQGTSLHSFPFFSGVDSF